MVIPKALYSTRARKAMVQYFKSLNYVFLYKGDLDMKPAMFISLALIVFGVGALVFQDLIYKRQKEIVNIDPAKDVDAIKTRPAKDK